jgi:hypothetical protein
MILLISSANSLDEYIGMGENLELPKSCSQCNGQLWRHGKRSRLCKTLHMSAVIVIWRLICATCRKTFSALPVFLEAYKRFVNVVRDGYTGAFGPGRNTYRQVAWSECGQDDERDDASASLSRVFRAVKEAAGKAKEAVLDLQEKIVLEKEVLDAEPMEEESPAEQRARTVEKRQGLKHLRLYFHLRQHYFGRSERQIYRMTGTSSLGFRLSTPHSLQLTIF